METKTIWNKNIRSIDFLIFDSFFFLILETYRDAVVAQNNVANECGVFLTQPHENNKNQQ